MMKIDLQEQGERIKKEFNAQITDQANTKWMHDECEAFEDHLNLVYFFATYSDMLFNYSTTLKTQENVCYLEKAREENDYKTLNNKSKSQPSLFCEILNEKV